MSLAAGPTACAARDLWRMSREALALADAGEADAACDARWCLLEIAHGGRAPAMLARHALVVASLVPRRLRNRLGRPSDLSPPAAILPLPARREAQ